MVWIKKLLKLSPKFAMGLKKGKTIEDLDILIASTCFANNLILVTKNVKHFSRIGELKIFKLTTSLPKGE